ncbi:phosphate acetyltransferase [Buchnera aphidicola (Ceratoglyphina bambusae)]|uniref:phosphate acetyltransferase n=1 Tax=Buchnera aphidicola TaxID=9 RepID=UPI0031B85D4B
MSRSIIFIPIGNNVHLTDIIYNFFSFVTKKKFSSFFFKILHEKTKNNFLDDTTNFFLKKKINNFINPTLIKNLEMLENDSEYSFLLEKSIKKYSSIKNLADIILIEGINTKKNSLIERSFNINFAKSINAKIIFISNFNKIFNGINFDIMNKIVLKDFSYSKESILGVIINKYNKKKDIINSFRSKFCIDNKYDKKIEYIKEIKKKYNLHVLFNLLGIFIYKIKSKRICVSKILKYLNLKYLYDKKTFLRKIKFFIFNNINIKRSKKFYKYHFFIIDVNDKNTLKDFFFIVNNNYKIGSVLFICNNKNTRKLTYLFLDFYKKKIPIFVTKKSLIELIEKIKCCTYFKNIIFSNKNNLFKKNVFNFNINKFIKLIFNKIKNKFLTSFFFKYNLKEKAKSLDHKIIFPEGYEPRILKAVSLCSEKKIANCILLGDPNIIKKVSKKNNIILDKNIQIINPYKIRNNYIDFFIKSRLPKHLDKNSAKEMLKDNCVLATLMLKNNEIDCLISGCTNTTANTIRPAFQIIKTKKTSSLISSFFFMLLNDRVIIYADCAINPNPNYVQLAEIAIETANSALKFGMLPRIAMISYSTKSSGYGPLVDKVNEATLLVKKNRPDLLIDGPVQYDVAISSSISKLKKYNSAIAGKANIFIFPDLNTGNSVYKAVQNATQSTSIGPILQGINKPVNDLSRGATVEDIVYTTAVTSIQFLNN